MDLKRDADGNIIFPIELDKQTRVLAFGTIKTRGPFHTTNYIFPVGYILSLFADDND